MTRACSGMGSAHSTTIGSDTLRLQRQHEPERARSTVWEVRSRCVVDGREYAVLRAQLDDRAEWRLLDVTERDGDHIATLQFPRHGGGGLTLYRQHVGLAVLQSFFRCATEA